jgi:hypothetical protein
MSEINHTPGPWEISNWSFEPGKGLPSGIYAENEDGDSVTVCQFHNDPDEPDRVHANARLIASAPELLAALQDIKREAERISDIMDEGDHWETAYDRLQCFIDERVAKATGATA